MADEQNNESGLWSLEIEVAGVEPASGKSNFGPGITRSGVYKGVIKSSTRFISAKGWDGIKFTTTIVGGDFADYEQDFLMDAKPNPEKDPQGLKFKARWKALMLNIARDPSVLEKGKIVIGTATQNKLNDREVYLYVTAPLPDEKDEGGYPKRARANVMAPAEAQAELAAEAKLAARKGAGGTTNGAAAGGGVQVQTPAKGPDPLAMI